MLRLALSSIASLFLVPPLGYIPGLHSHCSLIPPIAKPEFDARQAALATALYNLNASAYITEPSANSQYYANFSSINWKLSERPLLLIIRPRLDARLNPGLPVVPFKDSQTRYIQWAEEANPYASALAGLGMSSDSEETLYVDNKIRKFIVDGLQQAGPKLRIASAPLEITSLRERKSPAELEILKCANEATVLAIRDVHLQLSAGLRESEVSIMLSSALGKAGLSNAGCLTLFGANAALPHGSGTDRVLGRDDFALFDCGGSLHGYVSDVTRTVALPDARLPNGHLHIWYAVKGAQAAALGAAKAGVLTRKPDEAARAFLQALGLKDYFTHRLGHGIGLEGHEQPYLRGGSNDVMLTGHTFSNEPGVYIENKVGVRIEDCFYVDDAGNPRYLTERVGGPSETPWAP
ncbi:peptidase M24, structural domain-containing protein [Ephemerocybe angulata]|uniref:Peptidase M24, structural domain-containing protein n=1 Tax=Ephemerocybe angulata TaxID=980116 RepID=A0A8H6IGD5_9AGAR|nr:peptidase M24, structural domain-containing protein [Tulosesus angulatus]